MVGKKRLVNFIFMFAFVILLVGLVNAEVTECFIDSPSCPSGYTQVMQLSSENNAHGALYDEEVFIDGSTSTVRNLYDHVLCCDGGESRSCSGDNDILGLSDTSNAHAEVPSESNYDYGVCYGDLSCKTTTQSSCDVFDDEAEEIDYFEVVSLSGESNAHLGSFDSYSTRVCCKDDQAPICGDGYNNQEWEECDNNDNNFDGCFDSGVDADCTISDGWTCGGAVNGPSCCYRNEPPASWLDSQGDIIPSGSSSGSSVPIDVNTQFTLRVEEDFCLSSGASGTRVFSVYEGNNLIRGSLSGTIDKSGDDGIIYTNWLVSEDDLNDLGEGTSSINFILESNTGFGDEVLVESPSINVEAPVIPECEITSVSWDTKSALEGEEVQLSIQTQNCEGESILLNIFERDPWPNSDEDMGSVSLDGPPVDGYSTATWTTVWSEDDGILADDELEYYFEANVGGQSLESGDLYVNKAKCEITSASWNDQGSDGFLSQDVVVNHGDEARLNYETLGCQGEEIYFEIYENDAGSSGISHPVSKLIESSGSDFANWLAQWQDDSDGDGNPPEFGFVAMIDLDSGESLKLDSSNLLIVNSACDGNPCEEGTVCNPDSEGSYECVPTENGCIDMGYECGTAPNGEVCGPCGDGEQCSSNSCEPIPQCEITSASWNGQGSTDINAVEGNEVSLDVGTQNCVGEEISFEIRRDQAFGSELIETIPSQTLSENSFSESWVAEWMSGTFGNDPVYFFDTAVGSGEDIALKRSDNQLTVVEEDEAQCIDDDGSRIISCDQFTEEQCGTVTCQDTHYEERNYNGTTRCMEISNWGCEWDSGSCQAVTEIETQCGVCGNGVLDGDEQCDDGNNENGDGCSDICEFEDDLTDPCPEGTTLCTDGTCSLECRETDDDYDENGCTNQSMDGLQDSCETGAVCSIEDGACCNVESDGICNPYCSFVDQDCTGIGGSCGDGYRDPGEQCDMGEELNQIEGSGCTTSCTYEDISEPPCPEGTGLCNDGTCSLNCFATDEGYADESDQNCESGLTFNQTDNACCNTQTSDDICNPYCASSDLDCGQEASISTGSCHYEDNSNDDCEDGILERNLTASWVGEGEQPSSCRNIVDRLVCPAQIKVSFFGAVQFIIAIILVVLIYLIIKSRIEKQQKEKAKEKSKKKESKKKKSVKKKSSASSKKSSKKKSEGKN